MYRFALALALPLLAFAASPNDKLKQCCATLKDADKECVDRFCDFNAISQANILNFLSKCGERGPTVGQMWDCASLRHNHEDCCTKGGVTGECLKYCTAHKGAPTNYFEYTFCLDHFNTIRDCFHQHLDKNEPFKKL